MHKNVTPIPYHATLIFDDYTEVQTGVLHMADNPPPLYPKPKPGESLRITYSKPQDPTRWEVDDETGVIEFKDEENAKKAETLFNRLTAEIARLEAQAEKDQAYINELLVGR